MLFKNTVIQTIIITDNFNSKEEVYDEETIDRHYSID